MKKFFKALALVLALTLVIGTIPAAAAESYNVKPKRTLYLEGARGTKTEADGKVTESTAKAKVSYAKLVGIDADEAAKHTITAESTNKDIVKPQNSKNRIKAVGIGTADVSVYVDNKLAGTVTVTVKKNSTDETIVFGTKETYVNETNKELTVGHEYQLSLPRLGNDTDYRKLVVKNAKGEEVNVATEKVDEKGKGTRLWTLKFTEAGTYTLQGFGYQSPKYPDVISTGEVLTVVVAKAKPVSATQVTENKFRVVFDDDAVVTAADIYSAISGTGAVTYLVKNGEEETEVAFSAVKAVAQDKKDGKDLPNAVIVEMFDSFVNGNVYSITLEGKKVSFNGQPIDLANVDRIVITNTSIPHGAYKSLGTKVYAGEVEITKPEITSYVVYEISDVNKADIDSEGKIQFYRPNETVTVTAKLDKGADTQGNANVASSTPTEVKSTDGNVLADVRYRIVKDNTNNSLTKDTAADKMNKWVAFGDNSFLQVLVKTANSDDWSTVNNSNEFYLESGDDNTVMIGQSQEGVGTSSAGVDIASVYKDSTRTTTILLKRSVFDETTNTTREVLERALPIEVRPVRTVDKISVEEVEGRNTLNATGAASFTDQLTFKVGLKDQYGDDIALSGDSILVSQKIANKDTSTLNASSVSDGKIIVTAGTDAEDATVVLTFYAKANNKKALTKQVYVKTETTGKGFDVTGSNSTTINTNFIAAWNNNNVTSTTFQAYIMNGQARTNTASISSFADKAPDGKTDGQFVVLTANGKVVTGSAVVTKVSGVDYKVSDFITVSNGSVSIKNYIPSTTSSAVSPSAIKFVDNKYVLTFYNVDGGKITKKVAKSISVNSDQNLPKVVLAGDDNKFSGDYTTNAGSLWKVNSWESNDTSVVAISAGSLNTNYKTVGSNGNVYVYSVIVELTNNSGYVYYVTVPVNQLLEK